MVQSIVIARLPESLLSIFRLQIGYHTAFTCSRHERLCPAFDTGASNLTYAVQVSDDNESSVLHVADVSLAEGVADLLQLRWKQSLAQKAATRPLCNSPEEFIELLVQVLSRDIRSLHQRLQNADAVPRTVRHRGINDSPMSQYRVMLDGMDVLYNFDKSGSIEVVDVDIDHLYGETNS